MDIKKLRSETPGTEHVTHFNNAGASLLPLKVYNVVLGYMKEELNYGGYETARRHDRDLKKIYDSIADFIHAAPNEIAILENATAAWNMVFFSIEFEKYDRILTSVSEYASNYISYLQLRRKVDISIEIIPNDEHGQTSVTELKKMMDKRVKLVSITHIPTNSSLVNPVEDIGKIVKQHECLYLVDACQSVGQYPVDVNKINCDMLSATGRKYLRGPRGTGFLYVRDKTLSKLDPPFLDLHAAEWIDSEHFEIRENNARRFENWESNKANILGLKTAVEYAADIGIANIWKRVQKLAEKLRSQLAMIPEITIHDIGKVKGGIVTFTVDTKSPVEIREKLYQHHINVNTSSKSSTLIDMQQRELDEVVRASVHYFNTEKEIKRMVTVLESII
ncbi:MAG: aminotransferase class V-fold PLP-dependent enzyme [Balneolaceae bacterium]|jgi:selenocysteine lyase/cysteine desulfurase